MCLLIVFYLISWVHFIHGGGLPGTNDSYTIYICAFVSLLYKTAIVCSVFEIFFVQKYKHQQKDSLHLIKSFWFFVHSSFCAVLLCCFVFCSPPAHISRTRRKREYDMINEQKFCSLQLFFFLLFFFFFLNKHKFNIGRSIVLVSGIFMAIILILFLLLLLRFLFGSCTVTLEEKSTNLRFFFRLAENSSNALRTFPFSVSWYIWHLSRLLKKEKILKIWKLWLPETQHDLAHNPYFILRGTFVNYSCVSFFAYKNDIKTIFSTEILIFSLILHFFSFLPWLDWNSSPINKTYNLLLVSPWFVCFERRQCLYFALELGSNGMLG